MGHCYFFLGLVWRGRFKIDANPNTDQEGHCGQPNQARQPRPNFASLVLFHLGTQFARFKHECPRALEAPANRARRVGRWPFLTHPKRVPVLGARGTLRARYLAHSK